jgi:hypothetical protein
VAPAYVGDDVAHQRDQFDGLGMAGNHVADLVERYGSELRSPGAHGLYQARKGYDYDHHGKTGTRRRTSFLTR